MNNKNKPLEKLHDTEPAKFSRLRKTLLRELNRSAMKRGVDMKWFRYTKKTDGVYRVIPNRSEQFNRLATIVNKSVARHPCFTTGEIAHELSVLVNTRI